MTILDGRVDERFFMHRLRSTSVAGSAGGVVAVGLFLYHNLVDHRWNWELLSIAMVMAAVKLGLMTWYRFRN